MDGHALRPAQSLILTRACVSVHTQLLAAGFLTDRHVGSREAIHMFTVWGQLLSLLPASATTARTTMWQWILRVRRAVWGRRGGGIGRVGAAWVHHTR